MQETAVKLSNGPLWKRIIIFALPLAVTSLLQLIFNAVDIAALGQWAGSDAMAAVGAVMPLVYLNGAVLLGLAIGTTVVVAHLLGEGNDKRAAEAVHSALVFAAVLGLIICVLDYLFVEPILHQTGIPANLLQLGLKYTNIFFLSIPFLTIFNFGAAILRAKGETRRPMLCLIAACLSNLAMNAICAKVLKLGIDGVAVGTVISHALSAVLLLAMLLRDKSAVGLHMNRLRLDTAITLKILRIGLPVVLQGVVYAFSGLVIQAAVNSLGQTAIAASTVALNYEMLTYLILSAFSQACLAFNGICYGAKDYSECRRVTRWCLGINMLVTNLANASIIIFADFFSSLFTPDSSLYGLIALRLLIVLGPDTLNICLETMVAAMRGWGHSLTPALICITGICGIRLVYIKTVFAAHPDFSVLAGVYPVTWTVTVIGIIIAYYIMQKKLLVQSD